MMTWDKEFRTRLYFYGLVFFAITLPFQRWVPPTYGLVVLWAAWLIQYPWENPKSLRSKTLFALQMSFFGLFVAGSFWTANVSSAWDEVGRVVPLFFAPLSIALGPKLSSERINKVFDSFAWSVVVSLFISLFIGLINYWQFQDAGDAISPLHYLFYAKLSYFLEHQPAYAALYALFALVILIRSAYGTIGKLAVLFLFASLFLLAVRTQIVLLAILFPLWLSFGWPAGTRKQKRIVLLVFLVGFTAALIGPKVTRTRMMELAGEMSMTAKGHGEDQINNRAYLWSAAVDLWSQRPLTGWGTHEAERLLMDQASERLKAAADTLPLWSVLHSDLPLKNQFISDFYTPNEVGGLEIDSARVTPYKVASTGDSYVSWENNTASLRNLEKGFVGFKFEGLVPGRLYCVGLRAHDREVGGMSVWNGDRKVLAIREKASGKGEERMVYFIAHDTRLEFTTSKYVPSEIKVSDITLQDYGYIPKSEDLVPGRLNNALVVYSNHFNTHNQYLQEAVDHGAIGLILFLGTHLFLLVVGFKTRNWVLIGLSVIVMGSFITEHMLLRETGLFFYAFWTAFAFYYGLGDKSTPEDRPA